jgi:hypothetical protein
MGIIDFFYAFSIKVIPREQNAQVNALVVATSLTNQCEILTFGEVKMDILYKPSILDNFDYWQVFDDNSQVERFMKNVGEFANNKVDWKSPSWKFVK